MIIAFSICSNNFLGQAKTMLDSLHCFHPEIKKILFLADTQASVIDYSQVKDTEIIFVDESVVPGFQEMVSLYTVIELNTAVRPFLFKWLAKRFNDPPRVYYIDPDMVIYDRLDLLNGLLEENDIIITPHFTEPIPIDGKKPFEDIALTYGVFNVGFLALNLSTNNVKRFLDWWGERTRQFGFVDTNKGLFADQIWFNLVPVFFERVYILMHKGYNMAIWNLHERKIKNYGDDGAELESGEKLAIYHFSNWNYFEPTTLSEGFNRYNFQNRTDLVQLYKDYRHRLEENGFETYRQMLCGLPVRKSKKRSGIKKALSPGVQLVKKIWYKI